MPDPIAPGPIERVAATSIRLHRAEGPAGALADATVSGSGCWAAAGAQLRTWALTAPRDGSCDKTDFTVTFADGETYNGCYPLMFRSSGDLGEHIRGIVAWHADPAQFALLGIDDLGAADFQAFLDRYSLTD